MIMKTAISNKAHPEYGQATIPFPIPDSEYDHTIGLLEGMGIGSPTAQHVPHPQPAGDPKRQCG